MLKTLSFQCHDPSPLSYNGLPFHPACNCRVGVGHFFRIFGRVIDLTVHSLCWQDRSSCKSGRWPENYDITVVLGEAGV
jgi:hypothetical protein